MTTRHRKICKEYLHLLIGNKVPFPKANKIIMKNEKH